MVKEGLKLSKVGQDHTLDFVLKSHGHPRAVGYS